MSSKDATQSHLRFEEWKPVAGFEGRYDVSDQGNVWSIKNKKLLKPGPTSKGYLTVSLYDGSIPKKPKSHCVHDLVAAAFIGAKPEGYQVDHGELGKRCNAVGNLEYVTCSENIRRAVKRGLIVPPKNGGRNQYSKRATA